MSVTILCQQCQKKFKVLPARVNIAKYCSRKCASNARKTKIKVNCKSCGISFKTYPSFIKRGFGKYCSKRCMIKARTGDKSSNWKGGRLKDSKGYILIYAPQHPFPTQGKYVYEHRLVMEKKLGRYLTSDEMVHHKNEIKNDNKEKNLKVLLRGSHTRKHKLGKNCPHCGTKYNKNAVNFIRIKNNALKKEL